ncbi:hypothetical protein [Facklamia sp. 7083-14-GEN3]|uniref:hypothetical protein n=1 Tax=Facklamia sp. 7083-14-GEN3 TaxID=2973478 RepID=UPI00215C402B|nr:hypothetical protein [Facklamia sp. 7083-14-GEN3]MCR8968475.1 hypothetical protein [Facklamia sp. 7083-14-GEN3]
MEYSREEKDFVINYLSDPNSYQDSFKKELQVFKDRTEIDDLYINTLLQEMLQEDMIRLKDPLLRGTQLSYLITISDVEVKV